MAFLQSIRSLGQSLRALDRAAVLQQGKQQAINLGRGQLGVPVLLLAMLGLMTLPVPVLLLDIFFTFNIALSIIVLLVAVYVLRPLEFAVFPSILLVATLARLSLNVASTRVVLLNGHQGGDAAGQVIQSFGEVLIGGNYAVGVVVFAILMIINFMVVTKGAGRVSEVSARFTLDAMPGKQMAIDADLNAGLIDAEQAKSRRAEVAQEADFYGAMDGASKFVRGDAIAGILILLINIVGGLIIGTVQHGLAFADALEKYALLTIGDGLVAQLPSLLLSTAAAIMVTRNSDRLAMGQQIVSQMFATPKALTVSAVILWILGIIPGMPHFAFLSLALAAGGIAIWLYVKQQRQSGDSSSVAPDSSRSATESGDLEQRELSWEDVQAVDTIGVQVGYRLIPLVDRNQRGPLLGRIKGIRKKLSQEVGFLIPSIHIRDNLDLPPNGYRITLMGVNLADAEVFLDRELAINPGQVFGDIPGIATQEPAFGLPAFWIESAHKEQAQTLGYTVVDCSTVIATHLNQILLQHAHELLGHEEVQQLLQRLEKSNPKLAEELVPNAVSLSLLLKVLQNLLIEQVPIKDMRTIAEAITHLQPPSKEVLTLTNNVRVALGRLILQNLVGNAVDVPVITLEPKLEQLLLNTLQHSAKEGHFDSVIIEPGLANRLQTALTETVQKLEIDGKPTLLLVNGAIRALLARFFRHTLGSLSVLAYQEIPQSKQITVVATIGRDG